MKPKFPIPGRERQRVAESKRYSKSEDHWYKRAWPWITTSVVLLGWILINGVTVMQNAEQFPAAYVKARDSLLASYYDDSTWTGVWSNSPEGYTDSGDVKLAEVDVHVQLQTAQGTVDGTIATRKLCTQLPFAIDGVLFKGEVIGDSIKGVAYDYIGGKEVEIASVVIERDPEDPSLLKVRIVKDALQSFPAEAIIRRDPNAKPMDIEGKQAPYCEDVLYPNGRAPATKTRKPISELSRSAPSRY
jgi:hypothetical protein